MATCTPLAKTAILHSSRPSSSPPCPFTACFGSWGQGSTSETAGLILPCAVQYLSKYFEPQLDWINRHPFLPPCSPRRPRGGAQYSGRTFHVSIAASSSVPDDSLLIGSPSPPVGMVCRPPSSMAIAICPTTVSSPRSRGGRGGWLVRESCSSVVRCSHAYNSTLKFTDLLAMANGSLAHLD